MLLHQTNVYKNTKNLLNMYRNVLARPIRFLAVTWLTVERNKPKSTAAPNYSPFPSTMMLSNLVANFVTTPQPVLVFSTVSGILLVYGIYKISTFIYDEMTSPACDVPGPPSPSFIYRNFKQLSESVGWKGVILSQITFNYFFWIGYCVARGLGEPIRNDN